jgi:hypothetical protein
MKYLLFIILLVAILITAGCVGGNQNSANPSTQTSVQTNFASSNPSAPASAEEMYCVNVDTVNHKHYGATGSSSGNPVLITVYGTITSHCKYPVLASTALYAYDKYGNMIPGLLGTDVPRTIQDVNQGFQLKPNQSATYSMSFDMRRVPDNPRDPDPNVTVSRFEVKAYVQEIVSGRKAASWK